MLTRQAQLNYLADLVYQIRAGKTPRQIASENGWTITYTLERLHQGKQEIERRYGPRQKPWAKDSR